MNASGRDAVYALESEVDDVCLARYALVVGTVFRFFDALDLQPAPARYCVITALSLE